MASGNDIKELILYLKSIDIDLGDNCYSVIESCLSLIKSSLPVDNAGVFSRLSRLTSASEDLSWIILSINRIRDSTEHNLNSIKDPKFTVLVRSGRPSTQAIESEIRFTVKEVSDIESKIKTIDNTLEYLRHIEKCIDRLIWILRDLASYIKK